MSSKIYLKPAKSNNLRMTSFNVKKSKRIYISDFGAMHDYINTSVDEYTEELTSRYPDLKEY